MLKYNFERILICILSYLGYYYPAAFSILKVLLWLLSILHIAMVYRVTQNIYSLKDVDLSPFIEKDTLWTRVWSSLLLMFLAIHEWWLTLIVVFVGEVCLYFFMGVAYDFLERIKRDEKTAATDY